MFLRQRKLRVTTFATLAVTVAAAAVAAQATRLLDPLELSSVDARFGVRGTQAPPSDIVVVAIDSTSLTALDERWPIERSLHAQLIDRLARDGAKVIAYDVQFTEQTDRHEDAALVDAVRRHPPVVLATTEVTKTGGTNIFGGAPVLPYSKAHPGFSALNADARGVNRTIPYAQNGLRSFAVVAAGLSGGRRVDAGDFGLRNHRAWIDFAGPPGTLRTVSFVDVLRRRVPASTFAGKTVVVGVTATTAQDLHATSTTSGSALMSGAELQANAIETVREGVPLRSSAAWVGYLLIIGMAALVPLVAVRLRFLWAAVGALLAAAAYAGAAQVAFGAGWVIPVAVPLSALALATLGASAGHALLSAAERMRTRDLFARFVPEAVVDDVLARTDGDLRLGGQRREGTVMFCDLRGFTTFSENLPPDRVIGVLNQYFTEMTTAIMDRGGTLVAYLGDGILAVFGAPIEQPDHADRALAAAREMLFHRLPSLNAALAADGIDHAFRMGIGLHSGPVVSGNVGSPQRIEYAAIGDTTNTASRVEGMTKVEGEQLLLTGATKDALVHEGSAAGLREVGEREVRGRKRTITLWSVDEVDPATSRPGGGPAAGAA
ncbi:MAG: adenylate/guanylate cyclase domain-containing protein [Solirubrobacteraceae bacterium]|nr:adenylate/guanylate cyclase domain-containing protein [Patulibacter sp.]